jgi:hypothetical protein
MFSWILVLEEDSDNGKVLWYKKYHLDKKGKVIPVTGHEGP